MSETVAQESILTRAAKLAEMKKLTITSKPETTETDETPSRKKMFLKAALATAAVGAVTYIIVKLASSDDEDSETETTPED